MANTKKAIEEVTEKEIPRAAYEGVLTIDVDAQVESAQEQEDTRWHQLLNAHRTRKVLTGQLGGIEKLESGWTVFLTICGIGDAVYVYYLAVTRSYEVVEGIVSEIHAELFFDGFKRVIVLQSDGLTTELLLNKRTNVMHGKSYRFYFNQNAHAFSGIHRLDAAFDFGNFFGVEEVKE